MSAPDDWRPVRDLLGVGPWPRSKSKTIARLRRAGVTLPEVSGNGGKRLEFRAAEVPEVQAGLEQRQPGLPAAAAIEDRRAAYRRRKAPAKGRAERRAGAILEIERLVAGGADRLEAEEAVAASHGASPRTLRRWLRLARDVSRGPDLAPALADGYGQQRPAAEPS